MPSQIGLVVTLGAVVLVGVLAYLLGRWSEQRRAELEGRTAVHEGERILADARRDADGMRHEAVLAGKDEVMRARETWEQEQASRRDEAARADRRLTEREAHLDRKAAEADERHQQYYQRLQTLRDDEEGLRIRAAALEDQAAAYQRQLEQLADLSAETARAQILDEARERARGDAAAIIRDIKEEARRTGDREARTIIATAVQRLASDHVSEISVSTVVLPNDDMKGRIIGREGRNIRAFETATGVDVIIDDTPDTVVVSCFEPLRREIARRALDQLITDGRIHPGRIEEVVAKVRAEIDRELAEAGEQAAYELGIHGMHPELIKHVGQMKYRTSYGQNMYEHSKEVAWLAGILGAELKLDVHLARRGALLHDIGKVLTHQHEGTHVELGVELATKYGEPEVVINCIAAHHDDVPHESPISVIVQAADAASGARPGARREAFESYVKRLTRLEEIANGFSGVEKTFAIQAGREVRIIVSPDKIDDEGAAQLSDEIARRIEEELQYPGQIKVVVVRETRAIDIAR